MSFAIHQVHLQIDYAKWVTYIQIMYEVNLSEGCYCIPLNTSKTTDEELQSLLLCANELYRWLRTMNRDHLLHLSEGDIREYFNGIIGKVVSSRFPKVYSTHLPQKPKLDPDIQEAIDIADEGMKLQKEITEKTEAYQKKVRAHKKKHGSILNIFS